MYVISKENLGQLTDKNGWNWEKLKKKLENIMQKSFGATMFNFNCLKNNAYKDNTLSYVHFHFIPRYKNKVNLFSKNYEDKHFGSNFYKFKVKF